MSLEASRGVAAIYRQSNWGMFSGKKRIHHETFCNMTDRPTDQLIYILDGNWYENLHNKFQPPVFNGSRENHINYWQTDSQSQL